MEKTKEYAPIFKIFTEDIIWDIIIVQANHFPFLKKEIFLSSNN